MNIRTRVLHLVSSLLLFCLSASTASATPVLVLLNGKIATAEGVAVDGKTYDVDFLDGFCTDIFGSCNGSAAFAFDSLSEAAAASQALLDTVLLNLGTFETAFDARFDLTNGCSFGNFSSCQIITPYGVKITGGGTNFVVRAANTRNGGDDSGDPSDMVQDYAIDVTVFPDGKTFPQSFFSPTENFTWARWRLRSSDGDGDGGTPATVPEPASMTLLALGLSAGRLALRWRKRSR